LNKGGTVLKPKDNIVGSLTEKKNKKNHRNLVLVFPKTQRTSNPQSRKRGGGGVKTRIYLAENKRLICVIKKK